MEEQPGASEATVVGLMVPVYEQTARLASIFEETADMLSVVGAAEATAATAANINPVRKAGILNVQENIVISIGKRKSIFEEGMNEI
jgi:proline racemase